MTSRNLFSKERLRKKNGRFATPEQARMDELRDRNEFLEYENEMLKRKLTTFHKLITDRKITI